MEGTRVHRPSLGQTSWRLGLGWMVAWDRRNKTGIGLQRLSGLPTLASSSAPFPDSCSFLLFLATLCGIWDLSFPSRNGICAPYGGNAVTIGPPGKSPHFFKHSYSSLFIYFCGGPNPGLPHCRQILYQPSHREYWSTHSPGDLLDPGIKPGSSALQADSLSAELSGKPRYSIDVY